MTSRSGLWGALRVLLLLATVLAALGHATGRQPLRFVTELDLAIADARLRAFMPRTLDPRVVVVDIDEKSLAEIGRWPWSRDRLAALTDELFENQRAAVVGFDVLFAEPDISSGLPALERLAAASPTIAAAIAPLRAELDFDARFARALQDRNVVLGYYLANARDGRRTGVLPAPVFDVALLRGKPIAFTRWDGYAANLPLFARAAPIAGFFNNVPDPDGLVRGVPLIAEIDGRPYEPLALAMYRVFTGAPAVRPGFPAERALPRDYDALQSVLLQQGSAVQAIPVDARARVRVPFRGPGGPRGGSFEYVSATDLLNHRVAADHLKDKLVLVGSTAPGVYDQRATPVAEVYPGVEVHASLLSGLLDARLPVQPDWASSAEVLQLLVIAAVLIGALPRLRAVRGAQLAAALGVALVGLNLWAYRFQGLLLPLASALLLTALLYFGITVWAYIVEGRRRRSLARLFGSYVPPELVEEMARDPAHYDMRAENRELTVMFCDMRNFTRVAELLPPEDVRGLVNSFFSTMTGAIREQRGTLDKYIGDAIMAFWGAPVNDADHAANATRAALAMTTRLTALNADLRRRGLPEIGLGIGLNTGTVCVGDMGSSVRRSYTVMGDAVNLASRIEGLTRHYGVDVLVGEDTRRAAGEPAAAGTGEMWRWVEVDRVRVKGKRRPVTLFTPVVVAAGRTLSFDEEMRLWQLALASYRLHHWDDTQVRLHGLLTAFADTPFAGLYRQLGERTDHHRATPPPPTGTALNLRQQMILNVLGCSGSIAAGCKTTAFLLDGDVLIDAGTGVGDLELEALARIDHILISHSHLDHVLSIGLLADGVMRLRTAAGRGPIQVHALPETIVALRAHIFNGVIWPDFTRLPSAENPMLELVPFGVGEVLEVNGKRIEVLSASHTVPAVGFAVDTGDGPGGGWWVYTGDTGPNPLLWERLRQMRVAHLIIETAFSDEERQLARISRHLCPTALGHELANLPGSVDVHITHIKPGEIQAVMAQIGRLGTAHRVHALAAGKVMTLGQA